MTHEARGRAASLAVHWHLSGPSAARGCDLVLHLTVRWVELAVATRDHQLPGGKINIFFELAVSVGNGSRPGRAEPSISHSPKASFLGNVP